MKKHIQVVAILNIAAGALYVVLALGVAVIMIMAGSIVFTQAHEKDAQQVAGVLGIVGVCVAAFLALLGLPSIIGGWALYRGKGWARILIMVLAVLHLTNVPFGTALGVYSLWALLQPEPPVPLPPSGEMTTAA